eukprot:1154827-Pelagomonas_calceolata.AAC.2
MPTGMANVLKSLRLEGFSSIRVKSRYLSNNIPRYLKWRQDIVTKGGNLSVLEFKQTTSDFGYSPFKFVSFQPVEHGHKLSVYSSCETWKLGVPVQAPSIPLETSLMSLR